MTPDETNAAPEATPEVGTDPAAPETTTAPEVGTPPEDGTGQPPVVDDPAARGAVDEGQQPAADPAPEAPAEDPASEAITEVRVAVDDADGKHYVKKYGASGALLSSKAYDTAEEAEAVAATARENAGITA